MECNTAASVITYCSTLEKESAKAYEEWAGIHAEMGDVFKAFAKTNTKNEERVRRAYYNVISDALETGFCFKDLKTDIVVPEFAGAASVSAMVNLALELERSIQQFYVSAALSSKALLADVSREMEKIAQERAKRIQQLLNMSKICPP